jgi:hypothetical protein
MGFNSAFKGLRNFAFCHTVHLCFIITVNSIFLYSLCRSALVMDTDGAVCEVGYDGSNLDVFFKGLKYVVRDLRNILSIRFII